MDEILEGLAKDADTRLAWQQAFGDEYLRQLAEESGGQVYFLPPNTKHVTFEGLKRDLADSFLLTLKLPHRKGSYR
ncbi:MAG TPA: hypothetical protein VFE61_07925 [Candidatus Sulfotelmatobacter sp.]|nr:hypothetical protein [Candidatus Sulfotelmatobacter sp.]